MDKFLKRKAVQYPVGLESTSLEDEAAVNQDEFRQTFEAVHALPEIDRTVRRVTNGHEHSGNQEYNSGKSECLLPSSPLRSDM